MPELYTEPALYAALFAERTADIAWYRALVRRRGGPVLELGVGDGRVALAVAGDGFHVVGVDRSAEMLAALEAKRGGRPVTTHEADARTFRTDRRFPIVTCPFNGIAHFHDAGDRAALLDTVKAHLADGGVFAFDALLPEAIRAAGTSFVPRVVHPRTGAVCRMQEAASFDPKTGVLTLTTTLVDRLSGDGQVLTLALRQLDPRGTERMLAHHGFEVVERSGALGDSLAYVCRLS